MASVGKMVKGRAFKAVTVFIKLTDALQVV